MAVDGSFSFESELRRFLDRCPKLKSIPSFGILLEKGDKITEEEVVLAVGELVLHPNYTIPLLGCFRPIAQKIVERSVGLLCLVPNLRSDDDSSVEYLDEEEFLREDESGDSPEVARVIDVYVRSGKSLCLHELACIAFCRALDLMPSLLGSILNYFEVAPAPFERIVQCISVSEALARGPSRLLNVVRASYRFLILEPAVFTTIWDWSCFLDVVQQSTSLTLVNDAMPKNIMLDLRWCSAGILSRTLRLSFKASANLNIDPEDAFQCFLRWQEFYMDVSLEKGGWYLKYSAEDTGAVVRKANTCYSLADTIVSSNQISVPATGSPGRPFVLTSALAKGFEMVSLAVSQRWPVLLYGPAGGGKTALIDKLAHDYGSRVLSIHMDEQVDGKTLLGTYVCTEQPGEFRWQPGSLTQAVLNGFWVVFEDIDKAPTDIISILLPLLEGAITFSTGHGEAVRVNQSFRLFSTVTSSNSDTSRFTEGRNSLGAVWRKIMIAPPSKQDLLNIALQWYPELEHLAPKLIGIFLSSAKELQVWFPTLDTKGSPLMHATTFIKRQ